MRKRALVVALVGLFGLVLLLEVSPQTVTGAEIDTRAGRERVVVEGEVSALRGYGDNVLFFVQGVPIVCDCAGEIAQGMHVQVDGMIDDYNGQRRVIAFHVRVDSAGG